MPGMIETETSPRTKKSQCWRWGWWIGFAVLIAVGAGGIRLVFFAKPMNPESATKLLTLGSSMEPAYPGITMHLTCPDCGDGVCVTVEPETRSRLPYYRFVECPGCGFSEVPVEPETAVAMGLFVPRPPKITPLPPEMPLQRGDVVVFEYPDNEPGGDLDGYQNQGAEGETAPRYGLKRIVGLSGETVEFRRGDIFINGEIHRRRLRSFEESPPVVQSRSPSWPEKKEDREAFIFTKPVPFLTEEEREMVDGKPRRRVVPILNEPPTLRLEPIPTDWLEPVRDFLVEFDWEFQKIPRNSASLIDGPMDGPIEVMANQGDRFWLVRLDFEKDKIQIDQMASNNSDQNPNETILELKTSDFSVEPAAEASFPPFVREKIEKGRTQDTPQEFRVRLRFCDRAAAVEIDGTEILEVADSTPPETWKIGENIPITTPIVLLLPANSSESERLSLRVHRDLHISEPQKGRVYQVPAGEYLLIGDNTAVSIDSRHWKNRTIPAEKIRWRLPTP